MDAIEEYVVESLVALAPQRIILFGSRAAGTARDSSDVDILVVAPSEHRPVDRVRTAQRRLYRQDRASTWLNMPPFDVLCFTEDELEERLAVGDPFVQHVLTSGKTLYEQTDRPAA